MKKNGAPNKKAKPGQILRTAGRFLSKRDWGEGASLEALVKPIKKKRLAFGLNGLRRPGQLKQPYQKGRQNERIHRK